jgi:hypothetical protein
MLAVPITRASDLKIQLQKAKVLIQTQRIIAQQLIKACT